MKMAGAASQFGFSESELDNAVAYAEQHGIKISGIHLYATTRVLDADNLLENMRNVCGYIGHLRQRYAITTDVVNLGGGFGIPYYKGESELDILSIRDQLIVLQQQLIKNLAVKRIFFESGRFIVGTSGTAVIQVKSIKRSGDKLYAVCDGGYNIFQGATAFGNLVRKPYLISRYGEQSEQDTTAPRYTLVGPLCTPADIISDKFYCNDLQVGDYLAIRNVGAYSITSSPGLFIGHGYPAEYLQNGSSWRLIGKQDTIESMIMRYAT